ncbi:unnamed protein product [Sphagnum tenellum]
MAEHKNLHDAVAMDDAGRNSAAVEDTDPVGDNPFLETLKLYVLGYEQHMWDQRSSVEEYEKKAGSWDNFVKFAASCSEEALNALKNLGASSDRRLPVAATALSAGKVVKLTYVAATAL